MAYQTGELTERVTFKREVRVDDGMGGSRSEWQDIATRWALVRPLTGRERLAADKVEASANYLIVVRAPCDVQEKDIAVWGEHALNVRFVKRRGPRALFLEIEAEMGVAV